ncbi:MAG: ROK family protein [Acidobacteria bacterium]|nr:ROK family protein [Acidobacteriota bacterium]MCG2817629.1 ROK family protein [Actinomycetes bacterium]
MNVLGMDIGAGTIKYGVFSKELRPLFSAEEKTAGSYPALKIQIFDIITGLKKAHDLRASGIGIPGFISRDERTIEISPNMLFLNGMALEKEIASGLDLPLQMENDANAAALGEFLSLNEPRPASFVHLTLGSGIGSGIILGGNIWHGACGFAAELGHLLVNSQGRVCGCGNHGCAETESSEAGIVTSFQEFSGSTAAFSAKDIFQLWQEGVEPARRAYDRAGAYLGVLLHQLVYALNPEQITIGGGVAAAGEALLRPARQELSRRVIAKALACTRIEPARLGNNAGMTGAAALAVELLPRQCGAGRP